MSLGALQSSNEFNPERRTESAIQWTGDILAVEKASAEKAAGETAASKMWNQDLKLEKISRALLSDHMDHLYWQPAFTAFVDATKNEVGSDMIDAMRLKDPEKFLTEVRGRLRNLYSALSKGVHAEYIIPLAVQFDSQTIIQYLRDSVVLLSQLSVVSHSIPTALCGLIPAD
jgi:hypothetical protein